MNEPRHPGANGQGAFGTLYGLVLRFCPRDFRDQYGADLLATVAAREADWTGLGWMARQHHRVRELRALLRGVYGMRGGGGRTDRSARGPTRSPGKGNLMDDLRTDVYHSIRRLARSPGFTFVAILTLALGIGASTAIFSLVNGIVVEPLPYPDADRLVGIWNEAPGWGIERFELSDALYFNYREGSTSFEEIAIWGNQTQILTGGGEPVRVEGAEVTPSFFAVLQIQAALGRVFTEDEGAPGATWSSSSATRCGRAASARSLASSAAALRSAASCGRSSASCRPTSCTRRPTRRCGRRSSSMRISSSAATSASTASAGYAEAWIRRTRWWR